jgi:hypothetical protein
MDAGEKLHKQVTMGGFRRKAQWVSIIINKD